MHMDENMTKFEKTRIISARALEIAAGAPVLVKTDTNDPTEIAKIEFEKGLLPIFARKKMPAKGK